MPEIQEIVEEENKEPRFLSARWANVSSWDLSYRALNRSR